VLELRDPETEDVDPEMRSLGGDLQLDDTALLA
jgi:hypothetical protein